MTPPGKPKLTESQWRALDVLNGEGRSTAGKKPVLWTLQALRRRGLATWHGWRFTITPAGQAALAERNGK